jgi:hypothetical protein
MNYDTKPGYQTTEFWLTALTTFGTLLNQSGVIGVTVPIETVLTYITPVVAYIFGRSYVKGSRFSLRNLKGLMADILLSDIRKPVDPRKLND